MNIRHVAGPVPEPEPERIIEIRLDKSSLGPTVVAYEDDNPVARGHIARIEDGYLHLCTIINPGIGLKLDVDRRIRLHPNTCDALGLEYNARGRLREKGGA